MITPEILEKTLRKSIKEAAEKEINPYWVNRLVSIFIEKIGKAAGQNWQSITDKKHFLDGRDLKEEH